MVRNLVADSTSTRRKGRPKTDGGHGHGIMDEDRVMKRHWTLLAALLVALLLVASPLSAQEFLPRPLAASLPQAPDKIVDTSVPALGGCCQEESRGHGFL